MKRIVILWGLALLLWACAASGEGMTSLEMASKLGRGINLGNTLEACDAVRGRVSADPLVCERYWGQPVTTPEMLQGMKAAGFDTVRIPVAWMTNGTDLRHGDTAISDAWMDRVQTVVDWALDAGLCVILNDHWDGGWYGMFGSEDPATAARAMEAYRSMWRQIAIRFSAYDERLIFEGANEELGARFDEDSSLYCSDSEASALSSQQRYALTNAVNQAFVDVVRSAGENNAHRFLLIPGYGTDIAMTCDSRFLMPSDPAQDRLLLSVHYYEPWGYCGASDPKGAMPWGTQEDFLRMESDLSGMKHFTAAGIGVVIGEYGALPGSGGDLKENTLAYHTAFLALCDAYGYATCLWDTGSFYSKASCEIRDHDLAALYQARSYDAEGSGGKEDRAAAAYAVFAQAKDLAPSRSADDEHELSDCVAWIMWSDSDWALTYSVGDQYQPDAASPGILAQTPVITGPGEYTVSLDFSDTFRGYSTGAAFAAIGISNGELQYPGFVIEISQVMLNGTAVPLSGTPYTTSDDGICTRVNLYNVWVDAVPLNNARVSGGDASAASAVPLCLTKDACPSIRSIQITFRYSLPE